MTTRSAAPAVPMLASGLAQPGLRFPGGRQILVPAQPLTIGRLNLPPTPESVYVSKSHCTVELGAGRGVKLTHLARSNPTLVVNPSGSQQLLTEQGQSTVLRPGDAFAMLQSRPDLLVHVVQDSEVPIAPAAPAPTTAVAALAAGASQASEASQAATAASTASALPTPALLTNLMSQPSAGAQADPGATASAEAETQQLAWPRGASSNSGAGGEFSSSGLVQVPGYLSSGAAGVQAAGQEAAAHQRVLLLMIGVPGSGKSRFAKLLLQRGATPWAHFCQDTIAGPKKKGTRQQVLAAAKQALQAGSNVVIDRCNFDVVQRQDFLRLASELSVPAHAVHLALPAKLCGQRAAARVGHEGGVEGPSAHKVVNMMQGLLNKSGPPQLTEGLASIMECTSDADVDAALAAWAGHGNHAGADALAAWANSAAGRRQQQKQQKQERQQGGLMRFLSGPQQQPGAAPRSAGTAGTSAAASGSEPAQKLRKLGSGADVATASMAAPSSRPQAGRLSSGAGTAATAATAATGVPNSSSSRAASQLHTSGSGRPEAPQQGGAGSFGGSGAGVTTANSAGAPARQNAFSLLMAGGSQRPASGPQAGGAAAGAAKGGAAGPVGGAGRGSGGRGAAAGGRGGGRGQGWSSVLLDVASHPERHQQDQTILHTDDQLVLILDLYPKARHHALAIARQQGLDSVRNLNPGHMPLLRHMRHVALRWIAALQEMQGTGASISSADGGVAAGSAAAQRAFGQGDGGGAMAGSVAGQQQPPPQQQQQQGEAEQQQGGQDMQIVPDGWRIGFHSLPSMRQLHMHVISTDFDSPRLKTKEHWNSFTTPFFLDIDPVMQQLAQHGSIAVDTAAMEALKKQPLRCHRCRAAQATMPALKAHIAQCRAPVQL